MVVESWVREVLASCGGRAPPGRCNNHSTLDAKQITNKQARRFLNLNNEGYNEMDNLEEDVLQSYFGPYCASAKSHLTNGVHDVFFHDVAKFLLEVAFLSERGYCMPKQRVGFIITTYEEAIGDWSYLTAKAIR